jgi:hypothetical protein
MNGETNHMGPTTVVHGTTDQQSEKAANKLYIWQSLEIQNIL